MPVYAYEGVDNKGRPVKGKVAASDAQEALLKAGNAGHFPTDMKEVEASGDAVPRRLRGVRGQEATRTGKGRAMTGAHAHGSVPIGWSWDDPTVYEWTLRRRGWSGLRDALPGLLAWFVLLPLIPYAILRLVGWASEGVALWIGTGVGALQLCVAMWLFVRSLRVPREERAEVRMEFFAVCGLFLGVYLYLVHAPDSWLRMGFHGGAGAGVLGWALYLLDHLLAVLLLDVPEILEFHASAIRPESVAARCVAAAVRVVMILGIFDALVAWFEQYREGYRIVGTLRECHAMASGLAQFQVVRRRGGVFVATAEGEEASLERFGVAFRVQARNEAIASGANEESVEYLAWDGEEHHFDVAWFMGKAIGLCIGLLLRIVAWPFRLLGGARPTRPNDSPRSS